MSALQKSEVLDLGGDDVRQITPFVEQSVSAAEIYQQIATARQFPREMAKFQRKLRDMATINEDIARQCTYSMKRGGKLIEGPSIRFAELVLTAWGNAYVAVRPGSENERTVTAQAVFWDLESNVKIGLESARRITKTDGTRFDTDMIVVTSNAAGSIALRNCILRGIPKALYTQAHMDARAVVVGDLKTLATKRNNAIEWFAARQVSEAQVLAALEITGIADITGAHLVTLGGFRTAIEDEGRDPEEIFPAAETKASRAPSKKAVTASPKPPADPKAEANPKTEPPKSSDGAADAGNGAAGSASGRVATPVASATSEDADPPAPAPVTDPATARAYAAHLKLRIAAAGTIDDVDNIHAEAMKTGQWRAMQQHDGKAYADVCNAMATRQQVIAETDPDTPPD